MSFTFSGGIVIAAQAVCDAVEGLLRVRGVRYVRADGRHTPPERDALLRRFAAEADVALVTMEAMGVGVDSLKGGGRYCESASSEEGSCQPWPEHNCDCSQS